MRDINSLKLNIQFKRVYQKGKSAVSPYMVVYARRIGGVGGLGITASKKIGKAVERNRAKRRIRGLYRKYKDNIDKRYDLVVVARTRTISAPFYKLEDAFVALLKEIGIYSEKCGE